MKDAVRCKMLRPNRLLSCVVTVPSLNKEAFLMKGQIDLMVAVGGSVRGRCVAEPVLGPKLFCDLVVDLGDVLVLFNLEEAATGLLGHALEDFLSVDMALAGIVAAVVASATAGIAASAGVATTAPARITTARVATSGIATSATATVLRRILLRLLSLEVDGVDDGVGAMSGFNRFDE